ncbi:MAG: PKD domain-containing protein [Crocinitomicaceae bacterium]|nr:PKD domain-containing protein [Crocinitomicaceae bacterium]
MMDKFEKIIKESVEGFEAPYDAQAWANVSAQLGKKGGGMKWIIGSAAAVALISGTVYMMQDDTATPVDQALTENTIQPTEEVITNPVVSNPVDLNEGVTEGVSENNETGSTSNGVETAVTHSSGSTTNGQNPTDHNTGSTGTEVNPTTTQTGTTTNNTSSNNDPEVIAPVKTNPRFVASNNAACMNTEFIFTPEEMNQNVNFVWEFGDGSFSNSKIASHTYTRSGTYNVTLSLKDAKTNKTLSKSAVEVVVNPVPAVNFAWEQSNNLIPTINFINLTEDADKFAWDIKGVKTSTETQIDYTFRKKGTYIVELSAGNEFGCTNTIQKPIEVKSDYNLLAPTAFTPNGDNKNDYFIPEALRIMDVDFTMVVFDKSGKVMYQTTDVNMPWDGNNATDNSIAEDGAYVWKVQFKNMNGELEMYEGQVIITR